MRGLSLARLSGVLLTYGSALACGSLGLIFLTSNPLLDRLDHLTLVLGAAALCVGLFLAAPRFLGPWRDAAQGDTGAPPFGRDGDPATAGGDGGASADPPTATG